MANPTAPDPMDRSSKRWPPDSPNWLACVGYLISLVLLVYGWFWATGHPDGFWRMVRLDLTPTAAVLSVLGLVCVVLAVVGGRRC